MLEELSRQEQDVILQCMTVILKGAYIDNFEFQTRLGIDSAELAEVIKAWTNIDDTDETSAAYLAINNCMNEVCYGVDIPLNEWPKWFNISREEIEKVYTKWAKLKGRSSTGVW